MVTNKSPYKSPFRDFEEHIKSKIKHSKDWNQKTRLKYALEEMNQWDKRDEFPKLSKYTLDEIEIYLRGKPLWVKMLRKASS